MRLDRTSSAAPNTELLRTTEQTRRQDRGAAIEPVVGVHDRELERPRLELCPAERADVYAEIEPLRVEPRRPRHVPVQLQHPPERRRRGPRRHIRGRLPPLRLPTTTRRRRTLSDPTRPNAHSTRAEHEKPNKSV